ncbi:MAG: hypothetical protein KAJ91_01735 [Candidatus Aenigmarchaeota archaeon]|nr:hypothetical protein [Candidatus Aenigmarchaeota archaeon]
MKKKYKQVETNNCVMLFEILEVFRQAIVAIIESAFRTTSIACKAVIDAGLIIKNGARTTNPLELFFVIFLFFTLFYAIDKFIWTSAKTVFVFVALLALFVLIFFASVL